MDLSQLRPSEQLWPSHLQVYYISCLWLLTESLTLITNWQTSCLLSLWLSWPWSSPWSLSRSDPDCGWRDEEGHQRDCHALNSTRPNLLITASWSRSSANRMIVTDDNFDTGKKELVSAANWCKSGNSTTTLSTQSLSLGWSLKYSQDLTSLIVLYSLDQRSPAN